MKTETMIYDILKKVLPEHSIKTALLGNVEETIYEIQFFSLLENDTQYHQCFRLAEDGILDENDLDSAFRKIADSLKADQRYRKNQLNICTFIIDAAGVKLSYEYYDKAAGTYQIKKAWKEKYLV